MPAVSTGVRCRSRAASTPWTQWRLALLALALAFVPAQALPTPQEQDDARLVTAADRRYRTDAVRTAAAPRIDARIDEPAWQAASPLTDFVQARPNEGEPASELTEVRLMYDAEALYVAVVAHDRSPEEIVATVLRRDAPLSTDDSFTLTLDTYHDHRRGFYFEVNPMGAKFDAQIEGEGGTSVAARLGGESFNANWDAVWYAAARITDDGWVAEIAIPFWSLRFDRDQLDVWGINFRRNIRRRSEESYWAPIPRQYGATQMSEWGVLLGLAEVSQPGNLQVKPYALGDVGELPDGTVHTDGSLGHETSTQLDAGLDVKWGATPNLTADLTYNTDFSQVEADDERINLSRFSLFFPEKREFFLENAGIFEFGTGAGASARGLVSGSVVGFHSRSLGISEDNEEVPLHGGARLTGKLGSWTLGLLSMQSRSTDDLPSNNFSVVRLRRDLGSRSTVGVLATNRQAGGHDYNRQLGLDARWAVNANTTLDAWWMQTSTPGLEGDEWAGQARLGWGTPTWQITAAVLQIGDNFNPEMGFVDRTGIRKLDGSIHWTPYPSADWIRNNSPHVNITNTTDTGGQLLSRFVHADWDTFLKRGDKVSVAINHRFERLDLPFEIFEGIVIPPGDYTFNEGNLELQSDTSRALSVGANYKVGDFWSGKYWQLRATAGLRVSPRFASSIAWNHDDVDLPQGAFTTDLFSARINYDFSTRLFLAALVQYNSTADQVLSNVRLNFIHTEGADVFLVYNERRLVEDADLIDRAVILKATHLLRF